MQKDGQQTEVVQSPVRKASGRDRSIKALFVEEDLNGPTLGFGRNVLDPFVNHSELLEKQALCRLPVLEIVEDQAEIAAIL